MKKSNDYDDYIDKLFWDSIAILEQKSYSDTDEIIVWYENGYPTNVLELSLFADNYVADTDFE